MKKLYDAIACWQGFGGQRELSKWVSKCRLRIWEGEGAIVLFSDLDQDGTGSSITNCSENIAARVWRAWAANKADLTMTTEIKGIRFFEHYPRHNQPQPQTEEESLSEVRYEVFQGRLVKPTWSNFDKASLEGLIGQPIAMKGTNELQTVWIGGTKGTEGFPCNVCPFAGDCNNSVPPTAEELIARSRVLLLDVPCGEWGISLPEKGCAGARSLIVQHLYKRMTSQL